MLSKLCNQKSRRIWKQINGVNLIAIEGVALFDCDIFFAKAKKKESKKER